MEPLIWGGMCKVGRKGRLAVGRREVRATERWVVDWRIGGLADGKAVKSSA